MFKTIIRLLSFFNKEINEVRRQPRLVLSLILGPFLILLLFGIGYAGERPKLKTALVLPQGGVEGMNVEELNRAIQLQVVQQLQAELQKRGVEENIPAQVLVSPVQQTYDNVRGHSLDF